MWRWISFGELPDEMKDPYTYLNLTLFWYTVGASLLIAAASLLGLIGDVRPFAIGATFLGFAVMTFVTFWTTRQA